jgi:hypothetical protein
MATSAPVQTPEDFSPAAEYSSPWLDRPVAPREEALSLFAMIGRNGDTVESVRELIAVPARIEAALLLYADRNPGDASGIERVLQFRHRVAEEFERLVTDPSTPNSPSAGMTLGWLKAETRTRATIQARHRDREKRKVSYGKLLAC